MINYRKVKEYIESTNNITLGKWQIQLLKAVIRGDKVYTARGMGRSCIYNGYADYLKKFLANDTDRDVFPDDFDSIFTMRCLIEDQVTPKSLITENIKTDLAKEYSCIFTDANKEDE